MNFTRPAAEHASSFTCAGKCSKYFANPESLSLPAETLGMGSPCPSGICAEVAWKFGCDVPFDVNTGHGSRSPGRIGSAPLDFCLNVGINGLLCFPSGGLSFGVSQGNKRVYQKLPPLARPPVAGRAGRGAGAKSRDRPISERR